MLKMKKYIFKAATSICLIVAINVFMPIYAFANTTYTTNTPVCANEATGYQIYIDDWADLLTQEDEALLLDIMEKISEYGNVAFVSITQNPSHSTDTYAENYYYDHFGYDSGTVFLIDMDERMLWLETGGYMKNTITSSYALSITDNTYQYASNGDYYLCVETAFEQVLTLMEGSSITQPMKYISNALLALAIALLLNYFLAMSLSRSKKANERQILSGIHKNVNIHNARADFLHQTKRYSPQHSGPRNGGGPGGYGGGPGGRGGGPGGYGGGPGGRGGGPGGYGGGGRSSGGGHRF